MSDNFARVSRLLMVVFLLTAGLARPSGTVRATGAARFTVNSNSDLDSGSDGVCTLHEAIHAAVNVVDPYHECHNTGSGFGDDLIVFSISGSTTIMLGANLPAIPAGTLTIDGSNSGRPVVIEGGLNSHTNTYQAFSISSGATLTLENLTVQHGSAAYGAGAYNAGTLHVLNSTFLYNVATADGGAIENDNGTVTIANSTFLGNWADQYGGGLNNNSGTATILNSTFSSNIAAYGTALSAREGGATLPITTVINTIMANNSYSGPDCFNDSHTGTPGTLTGDHNIIENPASGGGSCSGITTSTADPMLGTLTGSPAYFPLLTGSPALDTGSDTVCAAAPVNHTSENGRSRPQGAHCDIGAFEKTVKLTSTIKSTGAQDGWVLESSENSNVGGTLDSTATTLRLGDDATKKQYRSVLSFNTGTPLPDNAVITKVMLKLMKQGVTGGGDPVTTFQGFMLDVKKGFFGTTALQTSDFQTAASHSYGPKSPAPVGGWYSFDLTSGATYINKLGTNGGLTQIRVRFKLGDNNDSIANYLSLYSGNATTTSSRPQLIVQYYVP